MAFTNYTSCVNMRDKHRLELNALEQKMLGLYCVGGMLADMKRTLKDCGIRVKGANVGLLNKLLGGEDVENPVVLRAIWETRVLQLNSGQQNFYQKILDQWRARNLVLHYLNSPGGMGKISLLNTILDFAALNSLSAVLTASSGVAALLMQEGQTAHLFGIQNSC
jgi:hypothetical protein